MPLQTTTIPERDMVRKLSSCLRIAYASCLEEDHGDPLHIVYVGEDLVDQIALEVRLRYPQDVAQLAEALVRYVCDVEPLLVRGRDVAPQSIPAEAFVDRLQVRLHVA